MQKTWFFFFDICEWDEFLLGLSEKVSPSSNGSQVSLGWSNEFPAHEHGIVAHWSVCHLDPAWHIPKSIFVGLLGYKGMARVRVSLGT